MKFYEAEEDKEDNDMARYYKDHPDDPYWLAHQLYDFHRGDDFVECHKLALELKRAWET